MLKRFKFMDQIAMIDALDLYMSLAHYKLKTIWKTLYKMIVHRNVET